MRWYQGWYWGDWFIVGMMGAVAITTVVYAVVSAAIPVPAGRWERAWFDLGRASVGVGPAQTPAERPGGSECETSPNVKFLPGKQGATGDD